MRNGDVWEESCRGRMEGVGRRGGGDGFVEIGTDVGRLKGIEIGLVGRVYRERERQVMGRKRGGGRGSISGGVMVRFKTRGSIKKGRWGREIDIDK